MSLDVQIIGDKELSLKFEQMTPLLLEQIRQAVVGLQYELQGSIRRQLSGSLLKNRSGNLRNSFVPGSVSVEGASISGAVGSNLVYARIQNMGGQINPKNAQNLTIPLSAVMTASGVARYSARDIISNPGAAGFTATFFRKGILFGKRGNEIVPLFSLKKSVTLRGRHYIEAALAETKPKAEAAMKQAVEKALKS